MRQGLEQGLYGLEGLNPRAVSAAILATLNFATPVVSTGFGSTLATDQWLMQDAASPMANTGTVGTETLVNTGGTLNKTAAGLWDGSSYTAHKAWESDDVVANADFLRASASTAGDSDGVDVSGRIVFRCIGAWSGNDYLLSKWLGSVGWWINTSSGGRVAVNVDDGVAAPVGKTLTTGGLDDGAWHEVSFWYDKSADLLYVYADTEAAAVSVDTSLVTGSISNSGSLGVNTLGTDTNTGTQQIQVAYAGVSVGTDAQAFFDEAVVLPGSDPSALLTTQSRASLISVPLSSGTVGHFTDDTLPIGYNANFTDANKLGLYCNSAVTNLVPYSELLSNWTSSNVTETDNFADSPDGFKSATKLAATNLNGYSAGVFTSVASTQYTLSVMIKEITVGCTGRLILYDETGSAEIGATAFTCTSAWGQVVTLTATTAIGQISSSLRIEVDNSFAEMLAWGAQVNSGAYRTHYVRTSGAAAATVLSDYSASAAAGVLAKAATGEVEIVGTHLAVTSSNLYTWSADNGVAANRRIGEWSVGGNRPGAVYADSAGTSASSYNTGAGPLPATEEYTCIWQWDNTGGLSAVAGAEAYTLYTGNITGAFSASEVGTFTATETLTNIQIGGWYGGVGQAIHPVIQKITIWDGERT